MFGNRSFLVKVIKDDDGTKRTYSSQKHTDYEKIIKKITESAITVIIIYFTASALRGAFLALVRARVNPF